MAQASHRTCPCSYDCATGCPTALLAWSAQLEDAPTTFAKFVDDNERKETRDDGRQT